ncbi:MAG TPA: glycosyltransferase family 4 protein [Candidatus Sulfotelmatobacter sp.]|jgi:phosphatidylinositol alpha-mannosyltransferase|nr:glycosyltransferase family 4 protein [Candidatus Sulfotelmatobacter sp.]
MRNKKPTIFFSSYDDIKNPHYGGGGAVAVHEIAKRLNKNNDVHVLSWNYSGREREIIEGVHYERFGLSFLSPKVAMLIYQLFLPFIARSKHYDVWFESFCPPFTTAFLSLFTKKPVVGLVHMLAAEDMERKYKLPFHFIQNKGLKTYKHLIVTSEALKKKIHNIDQYSLITVISNGVTNVFPPEKYAENYFLYLGRIEINQKGLDLLVAAFNKFYSYNKDYKLIIAGSGDIKEVMKLKKLIDEASLADVIILQGRVSGKIKESLLRRASCVVIPSRFETYSLVALEAMAHGASLVCFSIEGLSWISPKIAIKVPSFGVEKFAKALLTIVSDKDIVYNMRMEAYQYAKQYTWDTVARKYEEYLENLIN